MTQQTEKGAAFGLFGLRNFGPLPWKLRTTASGTFIIDASGARVARMEAGSQARRDSDATRIVELVNAAGEDQRHIRSLSIFGREWFRKSAGNSYQTAEIYINGEFWNKTEMQSGYGEHFETIASEELEKAGLLPGLKKYNNGGRERLRLYCERFGIEYIQLKTDVEREKDL
jgi:hypothetical protein